MYNNNIILSLIILRDRGNPVKSRRIEKIETQKRRKKTIYRSKKTIKSTNYTQKSTKKTRYCPIYHGNRYRNLGERKRKNGNK